MFEPQSWDYSAYAASCQQTFGVTPRREWSTIFYGTSNNDYRAHSNIMFSNGGMYQITGEMILFGETYFLFFFYFKKIQIRGRVAASWKT